jgi:hypothetical protein
MDTKTRWPWYASNPLASVSALSDFSFMSYVARQASRFRGQILG